MTPKKKAEQLFQLYLPFVDSLGNIEDIKYRCKKCALIAVDEIIDELTSMGILSGFWYEVRLEIKKL